MTAPTPATSVTSVAAVRVWPRRLAIGSVLVVAVTVFALSFVAISEVAVTVAAVNPGMGWLVPIAFDGGIIAGCATLWAQALEGRRSWRSSLFVAVLLGLSVWVNVEHAASGPGRLLARVIAGSPPVILFGALELVADQFLRSARQRAGAWRRGQVDHAVDRPVPPVVVAEQAERVAPVAAGAAAVATGPDGGDRLASSAALARQVTPADLIVTPDGLAATERSRGTVHAYVAAGGGLDDDGLAQAVAERVGCSVRTVQRVIARIRDQPPPPAGPGSCRDTAMAVAVGAAHTDNGHTPPGDMSAEAG